MNTSINTSWQTEANCLVWRWFEAGKCVTYNPLWIQEDSGNVSANVPSPVPDFARHSPFGSGEWFAPWNARWSLPVHW